MKKMDTAFTYDAIYEEILDRINEYLDSSGKGTLSLKEDETAIEKVRAFFNSNDRYLEDHYSVKYTPVANGKGDG